MIELVREYPWGTFFIVLVMLHTIQQIVVAVINRNKPLQTHCVSCCDEEKCNECDEDTLRIKVVASGSEVDDSYSSSVNPSK